MKQSEKSSVDTAMAYCADKIYESVFSTSFTIHGANIQRNCDFTAPF